MEKREQRRTVLKNGDEEWRLRRTDMKMREEEEEERRWRTRKMKNRNEGER